LAIQIFNRGEKSYSGQFASDKNKTKDRPAPCDVG